MLTVDPKYLVLIYNRDKMNDFTISPFFFFFIGLNESICHIEKSNIQISVMRIFLYFLILQPYVSLKHTELLICPHLFPMKVAISCDCNMFLILKREEWSCYLNNSSKKLKNLTSPNSFVFI